MKTRNAWLVLVCGLATGHAAALSLGNAHGRVLLGRPIDLVFDIHLDPGMELESSCLAAELVSGENPVGAGRVHLMPLPSARGHAPAVRVQTSMLADEPVLTVALSVGCNGTIKRTYTFLADLPDTVLPSTVPVAIPWEAQPVPPASSERVIASGVSSGGPAAPVSPAQVRPPMAAASGAASAPERRTAAASPRPPQRAASAPAAPASAASTAASKPAPVPSPRPRPAARPRLVMEPLAVVMSQSPGAGASSAAAGAAAVPASAPGTAASMPLAPASAASGAEPVASAASAPAGAEPESLRVLKLQEELARMRMQAASDHAAALALQQRVERIESERFHPGVVYGLLALVGLLMAWMAWQVLRFRTAFEQSTRAWSESVALYESKKPGGDD